MRGAKWTVMWVVCWSLAGPIQWAVANNRNVSERDYQVEYNLWDLASSRMALNSLRQEASVLWENKPLREGVKQLAESHGFPVFIDRRIDPSQTLSIQTELGATLQDLFEKIDEQLDTESGFLGCCCYLGPKGSLSRIQRSQVVLHDQLSRVGQDGRADLRAFHWPDLSTPTEVLRQVASDWSVQVSGELPHDLWHAAELGNCCLSTQLALLAVGFELEPVFHAATNSIELQPLGRQTNWSCTYQLGALNTLAQNSSQSVKLARSLGGRVVRRGKLLEVMGPTNLHQALLIRDPGNKQDLAELFANSTYKFEVKNQSIEAVLGSLAKSFALELEWEAEVYNAHRDTLVNVKIEDAKIDALLQRVGENAGLEVKRQGSLITVRAPK